MSKSINPQDIVDDVNPSPMIMKLQKDNRALSKKVDELKLNMGENEAYYDEIKSKLDRVDPLPMQLITMPKQKKVGSPLSAVMVLGDWHIGEYVDYDEVNEFNHYSWDVAQKRMAYLVRKTLNWVDVQRTTATIDELVIVCIGDFISGDIHFELTTTNEFPVPVQVVKAAYLLSHAVAEMAPHFKKVRIEFITADNHGRKTVKPQFKQGGFNSESYPLAFMAKERLREHTNVEFNIHAKIKALIEIQGFKYLCHHGNTIRGWAGIPWYGADRQVAGESKARRVMPGKQFHKMIIGHFHQPLKTMDYIVNGSLSGTTELDHGCGRHAHPCQVVFLVHPVYADYNWNEFYVHFGDDVDFKGAEKCFEEDEKD